ncbi:hypothetical protein N9022_02390 [bacterium]|jgi:hypothetical protein|nr:hypothetical protein [bacterium]|tara:strand:+ start:275 stop:541 length:267 start_codon:yes stop_codon:yes gene_type:complete
MRETMKTLTLILLATATVLPSATLLANEPLPPAELDRLLTVIKPQSGESPWREINWLTDVTEARQRAIAEDKPLVIFTAADGSPLGRT